MCLHRSVSLNNKKNCRASSEDKIAVCEKTAALRSGNCSDLDSACFKVLITVKIFQIQDMLNENRFLDTFRGHNIWPIMFVTKMLPSLIAHAKKHDKTFINRKQCFHNNVKILLCSGL